MIANKCRSQSVKLPNKLRTVKQNDTATCTKSQLTASLADKLGCLKHTTPTDIESIWSDFRECVYVTSLDVHVLGKQRRYHQNWFDQNDTAIERLLAEKHAAHLNCLNDPTSVSKRDTFKKLHRSVTSQLRNMQDTCT